MQINYLELYNNILAPHSLWNLDMQQYHRPFIIITFSSQLCQFQNPTQEPDRDLILHVFGASRKGYNKLT